MLEPSRLPIAIRGSPRNDDTSVVTSSGADVPIATIVNPMISSLRPKELASSTAPLTSNSAPATTAAMPTSVRVR